MQVTVSVQYWVTFFDILEEVIEKENNSRGLLQALDVSKRKKEKR